MNFDDPEVGAAFSTWRSGVDPWERASCDNYVFEERAGPHRQSFFERFVIEGISRGQPLRNRCVDYFREHVRVGHSIPDCFADTGDHATLQDIALEQKLVRVEAIRDPLLALGIPFDVLKAAAGKRDGNAEAILKQFCLDWNALWSYRGGQPTFAAFKDQLLFELSNDAWPDMLRTRLGLSHLMPSPGNPVPVALLEYEVGDVVKHAAGLQKLVRHFSVPTSLDTDPSGVFFDTPIEMNYGCPLGLTEVLSDDELVAEILHPRIEYQSHNVIDFGWVVAGDEIGNLGQLRNAHLWALRIASDRLDFGEEM
jgi:hypothetical protein